MNQFKKKNLEEDDLYSGFDDFQPTVKSNSLIQESLARDLRGQQTLMQTTVRDIPTAFRMQSRGNAATRGTAATTRPLTAVRGAGYSSVNRNPTAAPGFDLLNQSNRMVPSLIESKTGDTPEKQIKLLEAAISDLVEESIIAQSKGELRSALDKAKEAAHKERNLYRQREQIGVGEINNDLTFIVLFNLASQYAHNGLFTDALSTYQLLTRNRSFANIGRLRLNIANLHFHLGQYAHALKQYRMALDQVPAHFVTLRTKIMQNIGLLFVKMGQYNDACTSFEFVMQEKADFTTGLHLVLSYYALADRENMRKSFLRLLDVPLEADDLEKLFPSEGNNQWNMLKEALINDPLHRLERQAKVEAERAILMAAKLISPVIEDNFGVGYQWCVEAIKESIHSHLADDLEINKAVLFLRQRDVHLATETLKTFEKRATKMATNAAVNLSTIFYLQGEFKEAEKYADMARDSDPYNAAALVCTGNCALHRRELTKARDAFLAALDNDASCVEALFNLGLTYRSMASHEKAMDCFVKLHSVLRHQPEVLCQMADIHEQTGNIDLAIEWYLQVHAAVPSDAGILQKLGELFDRLGDRQQAFQYYSDSYRHYPSDLDVIRWLASYYVDMQVPEKAVTLYERAVQLRPNEPQWPLAMASCTQRIGNYHRALQLLKNTRTKFPDSVDCLRALVRLCTDLGLKEASEYSTELRKLEQAQLEGEQRKTSGRVGVGSSNSRGGSRLSSAASGEFRSGRSHPASAASTGSKIADSPGTPVEPLLQDSLSSFQERPQTSRRLNDVEYADIDIGDDLLPL